MKIQLNDIELQTCDAQTLCRLCAEPLAARIPELELSKKTTAYQALSSEQQSLLFFWILYSHSRNMPEFYCFSCYYLFELDLWEDMKKAAVNYDAKELVKVLDEMDEILATRSLAFTTCECDMAMTLLGDDPMLYLAFTDFFKRYREMASELLSLIAARIRENPIAFGIA